MKRSTTLFAIIFFALFTGIIFFLTVRGHVGNPTPEELNTNYWKDDGPLELSPERGRLALVMSLVDNNSFSYSLPIARFTTPDLGYSNGNYVSLFAPGVSYFVMPGYIIGKFFGMSQIGTYLAVSLFAIINGILIFRIATELKLRPVAGFLGGLIFLFATPAFAYGVSLYQHHISAFLILMSIYLLVRFRSVWALAGVWFLAACSIPVDYPNLFLMAPIVLYSIGRFIQITTINKKSVLTLKIGGVLTMIVGVLPIAFFLWFNTNSYGNAFQLSGTLPSVKAIDEAGKPTLPQDSGTEGNEAFFKDPTQQNKSAVGFFKTRNILRGFYIHTISPDRGILYYTPIMLLALLAFPMFYKKHSGLFQMLVGIIGMDLILYSMWGDPWGGWAFASRYMIPTYAVLSIFIAYLLSAWEKKTVFLVIAFLLFTYSVGVNTLGAITTSRNPPQAEVLGLEKVTGIEEKYTYERNWDYLNANRSKSFAYEHYFEDHITAPVYYWIVVSVIVLFGYGLFASLKLRSTT